MTERKHPDDQDSDKTNDIGKNGANPYESDAHWISGGGYDRDAQKDIEAADKEDADDDQS